MYSDIVQIDRNAETSIQSQIADGIAKAIGEGRFKNGAKLPSLRSLSARLGVSPATVAAAYRELEAVKLIASHPRSGFTASSASGNSASPRTAARARLIPLHRIEPNLRIHSAAKFAKFLAEVAEADVESGGYEDYRGSLALREMMAELDRSIGVDSDPARGILVTSGAQQAIALMARFAGNGAGIAVEDPTYPGARLAFSAAGAEIIPIPAIEGNLDINRLDEMAKKTRVDFLYCCPTYSNPSGYSWDLETRIQALHASALRGFTIIEDDYLGDLDYLEENIPRLARLAKSVPGSKVIRIHTFSKCLLPALRVASVSADEGTVGALLAAKSSDDICGSALLQRSLALFLERGEYDEHLVAVRPHYRALRATLRDALEREQGPLSFDDPPAGLCLLGTLEDGIDCNRFVAECRAEGVLISPGSDYWLARTDGNNRFRLGFGGLDIDEIPRAMDVMRRAADRSKNNFFERSLL